MTTRDILTDALAEIGVLQVGDAIPDEQATYCLGVFNRMLDAWNAKRQAVYASQFVNYAFTPNLNPHTIGPTGTFVVAQRPVSLDGANLILTNVTPNVRQPIIVRDEEWWKNQRVRALTSSFPTDVYYEPSFPNGTLNFWTVPTTAWGVELMTRIVLAQMLLNTTFTMPPGYQEALTLTLAEKLAGPFGTGPSAQTAKDASAARAAIFDNNRITPRLTTRDAGVPGSTAVGGFNYRTGESK